MLSNHRWWSVGILAAGLALPALATDRLFTYSYEPETLPKGAWEFEQWTTARVGRNDAVGQSDYRRWDFRSEIEYGVTDHYTLALYVNNEQKHYDVPSTGEHFSDFAWKGFSLENKVMVLNPAEHAVGLSLYLEPGIGPDEAMLEEKIILGQRHGKWKWAVNLTHETEWEDDFEETVGEFEVSMGAAYRIARRWHLGLEVRNHYELPEYEHLESLAVYTGPVLSYQHEKWWAALTVMPQVYGQNFEGNPDENSHLDLKNHERWNIRLLVGFHF